MTRRDLLLLAAAPISAELPEEFAGLPGQPVLALAVHPAVTPRLRPVTGGRQRVISDALRGEGPGIAWEEGWLSGHAHGPAHVFLAYSPISEQIAVMLWEGNRPSLFIPPRYAPWPGGLREPLRRFNPQIPDQMRFL
ncbi:hypothetical protein [Sabulicella glaciei]|uniref:Uncharacterized protein n=1 Tax=Sabulicella glaciei TaxID=2984948 RepID=A0ABT3NX31_9PROT|nr:hypothetical protein [Roseococcus sp. MDT2-1-1]MCW8086453.1 hypothetical protein [Roseococcus sp. MDT2-1-1]